MAMAARRERGLFDPDAAPGESVFDHHIYVIAGDGCLEEGVSSEVSSLAGTQQLGNLILFWDDNHISIEDDTNIAFTEDVIARYKAYGWHTQYVDSGEDVKALEAAIHRAQRETDRPSFIAVRTIIGWPAPTLQNTGKAHGSALGNDEIRKTKEILGFNPDETFAVADDVLAHAREVVDRGPRSPRRVAAQVRRLGGEEPVGQGAVRPDGHAHPARRLGGRAADLPGREGRQGQRDRHPGRVRQDPQRAGRPAARAVGWLGRPGREQQHDHGGRAQLPAPGPPDQDVERRAVRAHAALRHPRARHGRDHERHRPARRHPRVRRRRS